MKYVRPLTLYKELLKKNRALLKATEEPHSINLNLLKKYVNLEYPENLMALADRSLELSKKPPQMYRLVASCWVGFPPNVEMAQREFIMYSWFTQERDILVVIDSGAFYPITSNIIRDGISFSVPCYPDNKEAFFLKFLPYGVLEDPSVIYASRDLNETLEAFVSCDCFIISFFFLLLKVIFLATKF
ncbi:hypothetical protein Dsin_026825 [Dipteronia sinensis]|uniref:Uncharacterized protein n=1 Tax=Dipteronia sinensis TaxID=43782 RepID=A0AAD9ZYD4_9ROSI|nr:hypothetical protein Dsin_026825 [Dipteronia sinensis]